MPRAIDEPNVISSEEITCEAKKSDFSDIMPEDDLNIFLEIVEVLEEGNQDYIGETFSVDPSEHVVDENASMFRAVVEVSELEESDILKIDCISIEELNK